MPTRKSSKPATRKSPSKGVKSVRPARLAPKKSAPSRRPSKGRK